MVERAQQSVPRLLWSETRPVVQVVFAVRYWVGVAVVLAGAGSLGPAVLLGAVAWPALTASIYLVNGVSDLTADRANGSGRPLARGAVSARTAVRTAWTLAALGLALAALTGSVTLVLCAAAMVLLGWGYSVGRRPLKCSIAGTAVASAGGGLLTYLAGGAAAGGSPGVAHGAVFVLLALWMAVGGGSKDLPDVAGDRAAGRRTLPVVAGHRPAARLIAAGCLVVGAGAVVLAWRWPEVAVPALVLAVGAVVVAERSWHTRENAPRDVQRRPYRAFMVTQYAVNPAVLLSVLL